ncbi:SRPBCC family protein [Flavobacterium sp. RSB2_4_14]|uniref:SRPBCC family protein n=1 Tax=Flavobacterium sp. RSB2_4_14 TaxID=3447665 RepID=UPI003F384E19
MRILKYLFLLVLLALIGITVYVTTQKGDFEVAKSSIIKTQRSTVFDYVNDYKNWETFGSWMKKEENIKFNYLSKTMGSGAYCSWESDFGNGDIKTYFVKENDSIYQKANFNSTKSDIFWTFKDTVGGTKVTIHGKGKMDVLTKIKMFFRGGISGVLSDEMEKSLLKLDKTLEYEMKTYSIKVNGIVQRGSGFCIKQTISCRIKSVSKNIKIIIPRMVYFFKKNNLKMAGRPFVSYDVYDITKDFVTLSVCIPTEEQVFISSVSDVTTAEIIPFTCLKTTLVGDYSHTAEAWTKAKKYIADKGLSQNFAGKYIEVYVKTIDEVKQPSKWITEIYIPVFPKTEVAKPAVIPTAIVVTPSEPVPTPVENP